MKKVINGALYNTETARFIGAWEPNGYDHNNFSYFCESLYRTKSGKYFIHGEGHAMSPYGVWHENSGGWGEEIRPMSPAAAREWAEKHLTRMCTPPNLANLRRPQTGAKSLMCPSRPKSNGNWTG